MRLLVVNAGSSSLKMHLLDQDDSVVAEYCLDRWDGEPESISQFVSQSGQVDAVAHRVVHGGTDLVRAAVVDDDVTRRIEALTPMATLHQSRSLAGIRAVREALPDVPSVACFDTAYHTTLPEAAATYALPAAWRTRWGLRRFGFHGLSHQYAARRAGDILGRNDLRVVTCHLGAGASLCASRDGLSLDTTMGFTPVEGLVMATRSGSVDPGLLVWLLTEAGLDVDELGSALEHSSGLAGLAGGSGDMRDVLRRREAGDPNAVLAFDVYVHRLVREIAAMAASIHGLDALVFTGGVGEHAAPVREEACRRLGLLGVDPLDGPPSVGDGALQTGPDQVVSSSTSPVSVLVVQAREDLQMARETRGLLAGS